MLGKLLVLCSLIFIHPGFGEEPTGPQPIEGPTKTIQVEGKPLEVQWGDGRVAQLYMGRTPQSYQQVKYKVTEETCGIVGSNDLSVDFATIGYSFAWLWTEHPDPSRVGQVLEYRSFDRWAKAESQFGAQIDNYYKEFLPNLTSELKPDRINFHSEQWLPGWGPQQEFEILSWSSELMFFNTDTTLPENMVFAGAYNIALEFEDEITANIHYYNNAYSLFGADTVGFFALVGEVTDWIVRKPTGDLCQIVFKPAADFDERANPKVTEPLLWNLEHEHLLQILYGNLDIIAPSFQKFDGTYIEVR